MPESAPEPKIANMQNLINQIAGSRPNTNIKGSATGAASASVKADKSGGGHGAGHGKHGD